MTLLSKSEAATQAKCTTQTLDRYIKAGIGPRVTKIGGRIWLDANDVTEWLQHCRRPSPGRPAGTAT